MEVRHVFGQLAGADKRTDAVQKVIEVFACNAYRFGYSGVQKI